MNENRKGEFIVGAIPCGCPGGIDAEGGKGQSRGIARIACRVNWARVPTIITGVTTRDYPYGILGNHRGLPVRNL